MTSLRIEGCTVDDAIALARNNGAAFWEQPMWRMMWPEEKTQEFMIEQLQKRMPMRLLIDRDTMRHEKAVDIETGSIVGYARWAFPKGVLLEQEWLSAQVPDVDGNQMKAFEELNQSSWWEAREDLEPLDRENEAISDRILATRPYIKLDYLAVHPRHQGKGIATALVRSGLLQLKKLGIPIFVFAWKSARGIYLKLGFKEVDRLIQDDTSYGGTGEYGVYFMIYEFPASMDG